MAHGQSCTCAVNTRNASLHQNMDEMDFSRSIHAAAASGNAARVAQLVASKGPNVVDAAGYAPLHYAARGGHEKVVALLIGCGANVNSRTCGLQTTPLMRAVMGGHVDVARILLEKGADLGLVDGEGRDVAFFIAQSKTPSDWTFFKQPKTQKK
ncbi:ankyrin repeat domain 39, isoform CRA_b [Chytriomyces cf. hyalinus JEL632]|nr:ankyrin repeat domain 39, isoform CRA_b [Chytriomyces cf. hyalinus JEL632]